MTRLGSWLRGQALALGVGCAAAVMLASGLAAPFERAASDRLVRIATGFPPARSASAPDVAIVAIDPQSLRALPRWPWPRSVYADLVERLEEAGTRAIGFDVDFSTPREPADDARFAAALRRSGRVVLAVFRQVQEVAGGAEVEVASLPTPVLAQAAAGLGSVLVPVDADGTVRRFPRASEIRGGRYPSLAGAALAIAARRAPPDPGPAVFQRIDYRRAKPEIPVVSVADVLEGRFDRAQLAGRVVLVGATAAEFQDLWTTPLGPARPGVWIQAMAARTLAAGTAGLPVLRGASPAAGAAVAVLLSLAAGALGGLRHAWRSGALAGLGLGVVVAAMAAVARSGWIPPTAVPLGVLVSHYVLGLEAVRRRFGRRLEARERSLATLSQLGTVTSTDAPEQGGLGLALNLLGDVVGASGVALLRTDRAGGLDGGALEWSRVPGEPVGHPDTAARVLRAGTTELFRGSVPGASGRPGTAVYMPLQVRGVPVGVLVVERDGTEALGESELRTVATAAAQLGLSIQNLRLLDDLRATFETSVVAVASAIEARDGYTKRHCQRLAAFSVAMGQRLGLPDEELEALRLGALLHDVGKIGIRDEILLKTGRFSPDERQVMETHTLIGERIVAPIHGIAPTTIACVRHHHEHWDGRGYPDGLSGERIPLGARLIAVVDVWDALSTDRPYKRALPQDVVLDIMCKDRGAQFDPDLLDLFLHVLDEEGEEMLALIDRTSEKPA